MTKHSFVYVHRMGSSKVRAVRPRKAAARDNSDPLPRATLPKYVPWAVIGVLCVGFLVVLRFYSQTIDRLKSEQMAQLEQGTVEKELLAAQIAKITAQPHLRELSAKEFTDAYDQKQLPNVTAIQRPAILGDDVTDSYLRGFAEAHGLRLRPLAEPTMLTHVDGVRLQEEAGVAWLRLRSAAARDNIRLELTAGYRDFEEQRSLFKAKFSLTAGSAATGPQAEALLKKILPEFAPPGYSKHHSGYAIDLRDAQKPSSPFETTPAYSWLSANNYANAKKQGWVPSFPSNQPGYDLAMTPAEFVWVGIEVLRE